MALPELLAELLRDGGLTVDTPGARTLVQLSGDVTVYVDPALLHAPERWRAHQAELERRLGPLLRLRAQLAWLRQGMAATAGASTVATGAHLGWTWWQTAQVDVGALLWLGGGLVLTGLLRVAAWTLRWRLRQTLRGVLEAAKAQAPRA